MIETISAIAFMAGHGFFLMRERTVIRGESPSSNVKEEHRLLNDQIATKSMEQDIRAALPREASAVEEETREVVKTKAYTSELRKYLEQETLYLKQTRIEIAGLASHAITHTDLPYRGEILKLFAAQNASIENLTRLIDNLSKMAKRVRDAELEHMKKIQDEAKRVDRDIINLGQERGKELAEVHELAQQGHDADVAQALEEKIRSQLADISKRLVSMLKKNRSAFEKLSSVTDGKAYATMVEKVLFPLYGAKLDALRILEAQAPHVERWTKAVKDALTKEIDETSRIAA